MNITKYHKSIGFEHVQDLKEFINKLNNIHTTKISHHAKQRITEKIQKENWHLLQNIFNRQILFSDVIEYTFVNGIIQKALIRLPFNNNQDIILSMTSNKVIITIFINDKNDLHYTLNKNLYQYKN